MAPEQHFFASLSSCMMVLQCKLMHSITGASACIVVTELMIGTAAAWNILNRRLMQIRNLNFMV